MSEYVKTLERLRTVLVNSQRWTKPLEVSRAIQVLKAWVDEEMEYGEHPPQNGTWGPRNKDRRCLR